MDAIIRSLRSANYWDLFTFEFRQQADGHFDIYCVEHPEPAPAMDFWRRHIARDGKIDVLAGREPRTLDRALVIATVWAQHYSECCHEAEVPSKKRATRRLEIEGTNEPPSPTRTVP